VLLWVEVFLAVLGNGNPDREPRQGNTVVWDGTLTGVAVHFARLIQICRRESAGSCIAVEETRPRV
jgi:hypothetical protein